MPPPSSTELRRLAHSLAHRIAHTNADIDDLVQEGLWGLHQELNGGWRKKKAPAPRNTWAHAKAVMQNNMLIYYSGAWTRSGARHNITPTTSMEAVGDAATSFDPRGIICDELDLDRFLESLEQGCGATARDLAENLIAPTHPEYCRLLIEHARRKTRARRRGAQVRGFRHVRISHKHLRAALGLTMKEWQVVFKQVREFAARWLTNTSNKSVTD